MKDNDMFKNIVQNICVEKGETIGVGVSGGADSMVLLHAILSLKESNDLNIIVVHINHQLRGSESDRDEQFVKEFCIKHNLICKCAKVDVKKNKINNKLTEEESARNLRYEVFDNIIKEYNIKKFYLAHHANDQAETILMHIFRGSGSLGAVGMIENGIYKRPMLGFTKDQILNIAKHNNLSYVLDSTNEINICNRNILRNEILPQIEKIYPGATRSIVRFANNLSDDLDYIEKSLPQDLIKVKTDRVGIDLKVFNMHDAISYRLIKKAFNSLNVFHDILSVHIQAIKNLVKLQNGSRIDLPHNIIAAREYSEIVLYKKTNNKTNKEAAFVEGEIFFNEYIINVKEVDFTDVLYNDGSLYVCADNIHNAVWRTVKNNDYFCKLGSSGSKKLVDYFTDKKIPLLKRKEIPILVSDSEVLVVAGYDISDKVKVKDKCSKIVRITCLTNE